MVIKLAAVTSLAFALGWVAFGGAMAMASTAISSNAPSASDIAQINQNIADGNVQPIHRMTASQFKSSLDLSTTSKGQNTATK